MEIYDFIAIISSLAVGFVFGVIATIKVDSTNERISRK